MKKFNFLKTFFIVTSFNVVPNSFGQDLQKKLSPKQDFYQFVNHEWLKNCNIPSDKGYIEAMTELEQIVNKDANRIIHTILNSNLSDKKSDIYKAKALYNSVADTLIRNQQGIKPLLPYFKKIDQIKSVKDIQNFLIDLESKGSIALFCIYNDISLKNSNEYVLKLAPKSLPLSIKHYKNDSPISQDIREKYLVFMQKMLAYIENNPAKCNQIANTIFQFEKELALSLTEKKSEKEHFEKELVEVNQLKRWFPSVDWSFYFQKLGYNKLDRVWIQQVDYLKKVNQVFSKIESNDGIKDIRNYLKWCLLFKFSDKLSMDMNRLQWGFYEKELKGIEQQSKIEDEALDVLTRNMGEVIGKMYVSEKFSPKAKEKITQMIYEICNLYINRIEKLDWLEPQTKRKAIEKIKKINLKVGYPNVWTDFSELTLKNTSDGGNYFQNYIALEEWNFKKSVKDFSKPVNRDVWYMSPQQVNCYHSPSNNDLVFLAGFLQPPYFDISGDEAANYGAIGAVIGHEVSHLFDDNGSKYDGDGNVVNWWGLKDKENFDKLADKLQKQFSALEPLPGYFVDGKLTLGENIADLGGVSVAYDALMIYKNKIQDTNFNLLNGYTPEQRFFMSWAKTYRSKYRDEFLKEDQLKDPHAPSFYRAIMPLKNFDPFYDAFDIKPGDAMYLEPEKRVKIW